VIDFGEDELNSEHVYAFERAEDHEYQSEDAAPDALDTGEESITMSKLNALWTAYQNNEPASETNLLKATEGFIFRIVKVYEYKDAGFAGMGSDKEADDFAADTLLGIWQAIKRGRITESYFHYVRKAAYQSRAKFLRYLMRHRETFDSLEQSAEPSYDNGGARSDANGADEGEGAMTTSNAVFNSVVYRSGWEDENGGPVIPNSSDYGAPPLLDPKFNIKPYMEFIPWMERGPLLALGDVWEKTKTGQPDFARAKKRIAASYKKPVHWVTNQIAKFKRELEERRAIIADRFKASQTLRDGQIKTQAWSRIALHLRNDEVKTQVEVLPVREQSRRDAAYSLAAGAVVFLFHEEKFAGIRLAGDGRMIVGLKRRKSFNLYTDWDSEFHALVHLSGVAAESQLYPDVPLQSLSTWKGSRRNLHEFYAVMYRALVQFMHDRAKVWDYEWTKEFKAALPTMAQVEERNTLKVSEQVMHRRKVREWARKSYANITPMDDLESARAFVALNWEHIRTIAFALLAAPDGTLTQAQCKDIIVTSNNHPTVETADGLAA
jgi:hypothetical protein